VRKRFHIIAFCLASHEDHKSYEFLFRAVFESVAAMKLNQLPNGLSDNADQIRRAAKDAFGDQIIWGNCYSHMIRNLIVRKRKAFSDPAAVGSFKKGLASMHALTDRRLFLTTLLLFQRKWENKEPVIWRNFNGEYGKGWQANFFAGAYRIPGLPVSNNGLEGSDLELYMFELNLMTTTTGKNRWIKEHGTIRTLGGFQEFALDICNYLKNESLFPVKFSDQP